MVTFVNLFITVIKVTTPPMIPFFLLTLLVSPSPYSWKTDLSPDQQLQHRIPAPEGFSRCAVDSNSFAFWLRHFPLLEGRPEVYLYNGALKGNQSAHYAVLDIDVGNRDLQQCADAVMRLKAEYHFGQQQYEQIHFNFTSGDAAKWSQWAAGYRPQIQGNSVRWVRTKSPSNSYENFRAYLNSVFTYAGTYSLSQELKPVADDKPIQAGDVWIKGGFPGHAVIVADVVEIPQTGEQRFLLVQSYMPAQQMHLLRNPAASDDSPWYSPPSGMLRTPEWTFAAGSRMRFGDLFDQ